MTTTRRSSAMRPRHFEVAVDEVEKQPITFDYAGQTFRCRGAMPALPVLKSIRARGDGSLDPAVAMAIGVEAIESMFEPGELDRLLATGISEASLEGIVERLRAIYAGEEPGEGEGGPPATGDDSSEPSSMPGT